MFVYIVKWLFFLIYFEFDYKRGLVRVWLLFDLFVDFGMFICIVGCLVFVKNVYVFFGYVVKEDVDFVCLWYCLGICIWRYFCKFFEIKLVFEVEEGMSSFFYNFSLVIEDINGGLIF